MKRISTVDRERDLILATLNQCGGSRSQVCKTLGISRDLRKKKLDQYDLIYLSESRDAVLCCSLQ